MSQPRHLERDLDAAVLAQRQLLGQQRVDGLERGDLAVLEPAHGDVEDLERPRHLQADQGGCDAVDEGRHGHRVGAHRAPPGRRAAADGVVEVERARATDRRCAGRRRHLGASSCWRRRRLAVRRIDAALVAAFEQGWVAMSAPSSKMRISSAMVVDLEDAAPGGVGHAVEIAADADHALVGDAPLELQHGADRGRPAAASAPASPRRRPR